MVIRFGSSGGWFLRRCKTENRAIAEGFGESEERML